MRTLHATAQQRSEGGAAAASMRFRAERAGRSKLPSKGNHQQVKPPRPGEPGALKWLLLASVAMEQTEGDAMMHNKALLFAPPRWEWVCAE